MKKTIFVTAISVVVAVYFGSCNSEERTKMVSQTEVQDSCCIRGSDSSNSKSKVTATFQTEITCPQCKFKKTETLPTEICQLKYTCTNCNAELAPKEGDCCVFCSYGTHKCPSMQ